MNSLNLDIPTLLTSLRRDGVVVLPGIYEPWRQQLMEEHQRAFDGCLPELGRPTELDGERILPATASDLQKAGLRHLHDALTAPWISHLSGYYFQQTSEPVMFVSLALDGKKQNLNAPGNHHPHWDPTLSLRIMLYVNDVERKNGALELQRRTHLANHESRLEEWKHERPYRDRPFCSETFEPFEVVEAEAGTVLIFDVSITHRRGLLQQNEERRVAFGHVHSRLANAQLSGAKFQDFDAADLWPHRKYERTTE